MNPITYPARPINGGPLDKAPPKHGHWIYEPKYNGWRMMVHVPTGHCFNRQNQPLSIGREFATAIAELADKLQRAVHSDLILDELIGRPRLAEAEIEWADCEGLERRHDRGRGSLVLIDLPQLALPLLQRGYAMRSIFCPAIDHCAARNTVYSIPQYTDGAAVWQELQMDNQMLGCPFYEGLVAKRADSRYPIQLRSPSEEFPFWVKHRWHF